MVRRRSTFIALGLAALLGIPIPRAAVAQGTGTVTGHVTEPDGQPVVGASVIVSGTTRGTLTHNDGSYRLALPAGRYLLRTRLIGYSAVADSVTVAAGQTVTKDFTIQRAATSLERVAVIGTRSGERTVIDAPVPIDVLSSVDIQQSGRTETAQMLQSVAPSVNFPRTSIGDGTDHIRPASLRGLAPDQTLVLINGKRRHTSALVNLNGFVGRGSQAVDLNAIPASMIDHIEVLRDGAAAQYGSDAIAGVVNIVLKTTAPPQYTSEVGENYTTYNRDATAATAYSSQLDPIKARDGRVYQSALNYNFSLGQTGYLELGGEIRDRQGTNRTLADQRQQYFGGFAGNSKPPAINHWQGDSYNHDVDGMLNAGTTFANGTELYAFGGLSHRHGASAGFWRRPLDDRTLRTLYPDGFLPFIKSGILDASGSVGLKGTTGDWKWDLGTVYGQNSFKFTIDNSANASLGPTSTQTRFDAGTLRSGQWETTLDLTRDVATPWSSPIHVAVGSAFRLDRYGITAGELNSYLDGKAVVYDSVGQPTTRKAAVGSQVFPGFRPADAGTHTRTNEAVYVDLESDLTKQVLLDVAGRFEHYSDFGATTTGKVAGRYEPVKGLAFRGAVSTGFRAPSLGQEYFSSTATNFISGVPYDIRTFPVATKEAKLLGATELKPEKSMNLSAGVAVEPIRSLALTVDYYHIRIKDRIVLSDNFTGATVQQLFADSGITGVSGGRYFTNAIDTKSNGVDVVANYGLTFTNRSVLKLTAGYNHNEIAVTHVDSTPPNLASYQETLFGRVERARIEKGNPRDNIMFSGNYLWRGLDLTARTQRYGQVSVAGSTPTNATGPLDQTYGAKWITDVSAGLTLQRRYTLTVGADNLFDVYPDRNLNPGSLTGNGGLSNFGIFPYAAISPFGFNGRFIYTKVNVTL